MSDALLKVYFESALARGETVTIDESFREALAERKWPTPVRCLVGEIACAAMLVRAATAYRGDTTIQVEGDGPVKLVVVQVDNDLRYRLSVLLDEEADYTDTSMTALVNRNGQGRCALILDDKDRPKEQVMPYQGVVPLTGATFAESMTDYFLASEQVETKVMLASDGERAGGLMIQKLPTYGGNKLPENYDEEAWSRLVTFAGTLKDEELLGLDPETINRRLFWEESPRVVGEGKPSFFCGCSREAVENVIAKLGRKEALDMLDEKGEFVAVCRFCNKHHVFTREQILAKFPDEAEKEGGEKEEKKSVH